MGLLKCYIMLLTACWGIQLQFKLVTYSLPLITPANQVQLGVKIPNKWPALVQANVCTLGALWGFYSRMQVLQLGSGRVRYNFSWVYILPYLMHCFNSLYSNVRYSCKMFGTPTVLLSSNVTGVFWKLLFIYVLEFCCLLEIGATMFNWARRLRQAGGSSY